VNELWCQLYKTEAVPRFSRELLVRAIATCCSRPAAAERVSDAEHDNLGDGNGLDEQEGAIGKCAVRFRPCSPSETATRR
jgi:hypothetical protein